MTLHLLLVYLAALLALPLAQDSGGLNLSAVAGFDRLYKENQPVPVIVNASNSGAPIEGEVRVRVASAAGDNALLYTAPISLPTQSDKQVRLYVYLPPFGRELSVQLVSDDRVVAEATPNPLNRVAPDDLLYAVASAEPGALAYLEGVPGRRPDAAVAFVDLDALPDVASAWNALDILVLDDVDTSRLTAGQLEALRAWVEGGGQLVVTGGPGGPRTAAGVADLLPVAVAGVDSVADLPVLETFTGVPLTGDGPYAITTSTLREGELLLHQDGLPLLARADRGRGSVYFLALDPKLAPLAGWAGTEQLWNQVTGSVPARAPWGSGVQDGYAARQAVSSIPGLRLPSIGQLLLFLLIYTAVIGPINFLILSRRNRPELAWITIPALVLLFSAATYFTSFRTRGSSVTLNVMTAAYGAIDAQRVDTQSILGLYSPRRDRYDLGLPYDSTSFPFGQGFGALVSGGNLDAIERASDVTLRNIRTDTSEIATFAVDAYLPAPALSAEAALVEGDTVEATVSNNGTAVFEDAVLLVGQDQVALGDLAPGESRTVRQVISPAATTPGPDPLFPAGVVIPNPLVNDPSYVLGTIDYYNDPEAYPRWQLIQSLYNGEATDAIRVPEPHEWVTLAGWLSESELPVDAGDTPLARSATTLYLLEIPVR